jgi:hypothetical protein
MTRLTYEQKQDELRSELFDAADCFCEGTSWEARKPVMSPSASEWFVAWASDLHPEHEVRVILSAADLESYGVNESICDYVYRAFRKATKDMP